MLTNKNSSINFASLAFGLENKNNQKKSFLKKGLLIIILSILGALISALFLTSKIKTLTNVMDDYYSVKTFITNHKKSLILKQKKLKNKEELLNNKLLKLKLLKRTPRKLLQRISSLIPAQARLEEFNYNSKENLILKGRTKSYRALQDLLHNLDNSIYIAPIHLTAGKYLVKENEFEFTITLRL